MKPRELNGYALYDPKLGLMAHFAVNLGNLTVQYDRENGEGSFDKAVLSGELKIVHAKIVVVGGV